MRITSLALCLGALLQGPPEARARDTRLPERIVWSSPEADTEAHEGLQAIAATLKEREGVTLKLEGTVSPVSRARALRDGRAHFAATSVAGSFHAQEGLFEFAGGHWGPQPVRLVLMNRGERLLSIVTAASARVRQIADLRDKRVAWVADAPALNHHVTALLAFASLGWQDVRKTEFPSYGTALAALAADRVDAVFAASTAAPLTALAESTRGIAHPIVAHADTEGWQRIEKLAPYFIPITATSGAGLSKKSPVESVTYPFPILLTLASRDAEQVQAVLRALITHFDDYRTRSAGNQGWAIGLQPLSWAVPFHKGAVQELRERGHWSDRHQAHNDRLLARQKVLRQTWEALPRQAFDSEETLGAAWMKARARALREAGFEPYIERW